MTIDPLAYERTGGAWLHTALAPVSDFGRRADDVARPFGPGDESAAGAAIARVVHLAGALDPEAVPRLRAAIRSAPDVTPLGGRARAGDPLDDVDFYELTRFVDALAEVTRQWERAGGDAAGRPPPADALTAALAPGRLTAGGFRLADAFDPALAPARRVLADAESAAAAARTRLAATASAALGFAVDGDEFVLLRDVVAGPLPPGIRVVRETPAYRLCALELDAAGVAAAGARDTALAALADVEASARRRLAAAVAAAADTLAAAARALGELDRLLARVAFAQRWGAVVPVFVERGIALGGATFPPLAEALLRDGRAYDPIDVAVEGVAVLSGPNMGGKSAALATLGFAAACIACGTPPPARSARLPLYAGVAWLGGSDTGRTRLLSAFGVEVVRARDLFAGTVPPALVLVDEFARTTAPREGRALLVAVVEALGRRGLDALVATHFDGVAEAAGVPHLAIAGFDEAALAQLDGADLAAALEALGAAMDYRVVPAGQARPAGSGALLVARVLGLDAAIVARATLALSGTR